MTTNAVQYLFYASARTLQQPNRISSTLKLGQLSKPSTTRHTPPKPDKKR